MFTDNLLPSSVAFICITVPNLRLTATFVIGRLDTLIGNRGAA